MSRCYILGAGFSNAVADLPPMKKLTEKFQEVLRREEELGHDNRVFSGRQLLEYLQRFERTFFVKPCLGPGEQYSGCNFKENIEAIVSFIDLNLASDIDALVTDAQGRSSHRTKHSPFWEGYDLTQLRGHIATYLYLALIGPHEPRPLLKDFVDCLSEGDVVITFNYDLVVDSELWRQRKWNPGNGYGPTFNSPGISQEASEVSTRFPIYKLHGSLNWSSPGPFEGPITLQGFYDDGKPIFPGYLADESPPPYGQYQGAHAPCSLMPSFVKKFDVPELLTVWGRAQEAIRASDEVIVIGYSLPEADAAACLLLGATRLKEKRLTIVDQNEHDLRLKFKRITGAEAVETFTEVAEYVKRRLTPASS